MELDREEIFFIKCALKNLSKKYGRIMEKDLDEKDFEKYYDHSLSKNKIDNLIKKMRD